MKVDKLYTLSQFIDLQQSIIGKETGITSPENLTANNVDRYNTASLHAYGRIKKYNNFLNRPLTRNMFINDLAKKTKGELSLQNVII